MGTSALHTCFVRGLGCPLHPCSTVLSQCAVAGGPPLPHLAQDSLWVIVLSKDVGPSSFLPWGAQRESGDAVWMCLPGCPSVPLLLVPVLLGFHPCFARLHPAFLCFYSVHSKMLLTLSSALFLHVALGSFVAGLPRGSLVAALSLASCSGNGRCVWETGGQSCFLLLSLGF